MDELDAFLNGLDDLAKNNEKLMQEYFRENFPRYLQIAQTTAHQILSALRPPEIEADEWERRIGRFATLILVESIQTSAGFRVAYDGSGDDEAENQSDAIHGEITFEDIEDWIKAGRENQPEGKDISRAEAGASDREIAYTVYKALTNPELGFNSKDTSRLRAAIQKFLSTSTSYSIEPFLENVLDAWETIFYETVAQDLDAAWDSILANI